MLKTTCINPEIMKVLPFLGHGDKILIADGNYPLESKSGSAAKVYLGLTSGIPETTQVLQTLKGIINIEQATVMVPKDFTPPIFDEFINILDGLKLDTLSRHDFYEACCEPSVRLSISTGERRTYSNILITVGVV